MKLNNSALQKLYETIVNGTFVLSMYAASPIDKAFKECDEKLSESITFEQIKNLQSDNDILKRSNEALLSANMEAISKGRKLEKELIDAKKQLKYFTQSRDDWRSRAKHAEKDIEYLKNDNEWLKHSRLEWAKKVAERGRQISELKETLEKANADRTELQKDRDSYHDLYTQLSKAYVKLSDENRKLKARTDCLRTEVEWYRKHYKEQSDKIQELKKQLGELTSQYQTLTIENKRLRHSIRSSYYKGQTDLWVKLQNVNDSQPFELATCFPDVTGMEDILSWDLEDFLDAYKKWQEEKEKERLDHMRDYLDRFCRGRLCSGCPLESNEYKCGYGYSFRKFADDDWKIIPDEELERYYEKARDCSKCAWHGDATTEKIKFEPWTCTLEGTINVEINRDVLNKICGINSDD